MKGKTHVAHFSSYFQTSNSPLAHFFVHMCVTSFYSAQQEHFHVLRCKLEEEVIKISNKRSLRSPNCVDLSVDALFLRAYNHIRFYSAAERVNPLLFCVDNIELLQFSFLFFLLLKIILTGMWSLLLTSAMQRKVLVIS